MDGEDSSSDEEGFVTYVGGKRKKLDDAGAGGENLVKNQLQNNKLAVQQEETPRRYHLANGSNLPSW